MISGTEVTEQEFTAGCFSYCKLSAGVDCAEMIEVPITGGKSQQYTLVSSFDTEKPVKW